MNHGTSRRILLISSNTSGTGRLFVTTARRMGFEPLLLDPNPGRYRFALELGVETQQIDLDDAETLDRRVGELARNIDIAGVTSSSEYYQSAAARVARLLGLPGGDSDALRRCRDKAEQRRKLGHAGVAQPRYVEVQTPDAAVEAAGRLGFPVVVKPLDGTGSVGVTLALAKDQVQRAAARLFNSRVNERGMPVAPRLLVEEYVDGPEYSVELWHGRAVGVTEKHLGRPPHFVEIGHTFPAPVADATRSSLIETAEAAVEALGVRFGGGHVELRDSYAGPKVVEVNPRLAGGFIPSLVALTGIDLIGRLVAAVTGVIVPSETAIAPAAAIRFILPPGDGVLAEVCGLNECREKPGTAEVSVYTVPGEPVGLFGDFRDRIGHVIAFGDNPMQAAERAEVARSLVRVSLSETASKKEECHE
jgi:biotin carboxylase